MGQAACPGQPECQPVVVDVQRVLRAPEVDRAAKKGGVARRTHGRRVHHLHHRGGPHGLARLAQLLHGGRKRQLHQEGRQIVLPAKGLGDQHQAVRRDAFPQLKQVAGAGGVAQAQPQGIAQGRGAQQPQCQRPPVGQHHLPSQAQRQIRLRHQAQAPAHQGGGLPVRHRQAGFCQVCGAHALSPLVRHRQAWVSRLGAPFKACCRLHPSRSMSAPGVLAFPVSVGTSRIGCCVRQRTWRGPPQGPLDGPQTATNCASMAYRWAAGPPGRTNDCLLDRLHARWVDVCRPPPGQWPAVLPPHRSPFPRPLNMTLFRNLGISGRLYGVSLLLITALTALAISTWSQLLHVRDLAQSAGSVKVLQLELIASTELKVSQVLSDLRQALLMKTPKDTELAVQGIQAKRTQISKNDADYLKELRSQDSRDAFQRDWLQLQTVTWPVAEANLQLLKDGKTEEAQTMLIKQTIPAYARMQDWLVTARSAQGKSLSQEVDAIGAAADSIRIFLVTLVAAISVGLLAFSWYIARLLRGRVTASREVAERVRQGDFTVPVDASVRDEFSPLLQSLSAMQDSLTTVVGTVRENAESVATASAQIAQGNQDLSQRTEEQASSLEETAASMEQLGSTVRQTSDNANQANQLAKGATAVAIKGGHVVGQVVNTMRGINESSRKIADIIGVIDSIAFQTNILALNAAVEAARAGEQGRGFAVVASEVRSLAQRSAEAAKEIKALISASVERVEQGTQLVDQAGVTMSEIVASIQRVTDLMGEISSAASEQNAGVSQVGQAVMQMDQVTQQNASLVEQSAAAAESLKAQALQLVLAVSVFRLAHDAHAPQRAVHAAAALAARPVASRLPVRGLGAARPAWRAQGSLAAPAARHVPSAQDSF